MAQSFHRRQMLAGAGAAAAWALWGTGRRTWAAAAPKAVFHEVKVISHQPEFYHGWPALTRRKSGELLLAYSGGREAHVCPFGRVELMRSHDDGKTWGWPCVLADTEVDDRGAGVMETAKGTILVNWFTSVTYYDADGTMAAWSLAAAEKIPADKPGAWPADRLKRWRTAHDRITAEQRKKLLGTWLIRSTDGGLTWSGPYASIVDSPTGPIQLADGRLLYVGQKLYEGYQVGACTSSDDGRTWRWLTELPHRSCDNNTHYFEPCAVETRRGHLVVHLRNHNTKNDGETLQTESSDGGRTWTTPHSIGVWGLPSHLRRLKDGRLLMSYGHCRVPFGTKARVSEDHGRTWSEAITLSGDGIGLDVGYPTTVQLADESLLTVWYEIMKDNPHAVLRQAHWSLG